MNRPMLLATGVAIAGLIALIAARRGQSPSVAANIGAGPESAEHRDGGQEPAAVAQAQPAATEVELTPARRFFNEQSRRAGRDLGDMHLEGDIDLTHLGRRDDAYIAGLPDGAHAVLTIDRTLEEAAEAVLARARAPQAAIVVMSVDGRILALAGRRGKHSDPSLALRVWAPAASVFKLVTAAALVENGVKPSTRVCYHGGVRSVTAGNLRDDKKRDRQCNSLSFAIARSQNAIVAKLAHKHLSPVSLRDMAERFGFGDAPPFALDMQPSRADIPEDELAFARVAAGFWQTELSPMGGALVAATIASGGHAVTPRIAERVVSRDGSVSEIEPVPPRRVLPESTARAVADMMVGTTEYGSARKGFHDRRGRPFMKGMKVAGKTGTLTRRASGYLQYSWFVGFAPADEPRVIVSVLLGNPAVWHLKAHTAARLVLEKAF